MPSDTEREAAELAAFKAATAGKKEAPEPNVYALERLSALEAEKASLEKQQREIQYKLDDLNADMARRVQVVAPLEAVKVRGKWYVKA